MRGIEGDLQFLSYSAYTSADKIGKPDHVRVSGFSTQLRGLPVLPRKLDCNSAGSNVLKANVLLCMYVLEKNGKHVLIILHGKEEKKKNF